MGSSLGGLCTTLTLALGLAGCCDDVGCIGALFTVTVQISTGADRVEVMQADKGFTCDVEEVPSTECFIDEEGETRSFTIPNVREGELTLRILAADEVLSDEVVTPVWKDVTPDDACGDTVCKQARITP